MFLVILFAFIFSIRKIILKQMSNLYLCPDGKSLLLSYRLIYMIILDFWRCPIDLNHQVLAKRFQYHIRRCTIVSWDHFLGIFNRKQVFAFALIYFFQANPHIRRVRCVFNANHLTTPDDLLHHMSTCPDAISTSTVLIGLSDIRKFRNLRYQ